MQHHLDSVRRRFDAQAGAYAATSPQAIRSSVQAVGQFLAGRRVARALDVGAGPGTVALLLAFHAEAVAALDVSAAMLDICRERAHDQGLANVGPIQGDSLNLPFPAGAFDLVASQLMLHHSADPTHALAEMARVCIAGGTLIISDMISPPDPAAAQLLNRFELIRDPSHTRALARSELTKMLEERGFQIEELQEARARLELEDWLHRGGADPAARVHLREEFARLPDSLRRTFNVELIDGVTHFNWPMLVLRTVMS